MTDFFKLKIVAISHYISRSGTLYIHSLLDDHPEIATIPGTINIVNLLQIRKDLTAEECFQIFKIDNPKFFDTSKFTFLDKNNSSLWILGDYKNEKIITDENLFKKIFLSSLKDKKINPRNILIGLYYAYAKIHNKEMQKLKIILMHPHEKNTTLKFNNFFKDALYLIPVRNPIRAYHGIIKKTRYVNKLRKVDYYPSGQLIESALDIEDFYKKKLDMYFIKIEDLGLNLKNIMTMICKVLKINFNLSMLKSTFGGKKYWSNSVDRQTSHFDKSRHNNKIELPRKDLIILELLNLDLMRKLNYQSIKLSFYEKLVSPILIFFPMKDEIDFLKDFDFSKLKIYLKFLIFFIPKRLRMLQIVLLNRISKKYEYILKRNLN